MAGSIDLDSLPSALWFSIFVFLTHRCGGQPQVVGPSEPIVATVGDDIMLPCHLSPAVDASDQTVEWARPDLNPRFVYVWRDGVELKTKQHPFYVGRTSLHVSKLKHGDISLKLSKVKLSDEGTYRCFLPTLNRDSSVQLVVGTVSSLIINLMRTENNEEVVLQCDSEGWYPEPEVFWLDAEGNLLSAGPTETVRGPDDLYTVSRRLTVKKSDSFTCRVQQKNITQTRETHFYVPGHFFPVQSLSWTDIIFTLVLLLVILLICFWAERKLRTIMKLIILHKNTKASQTNGSDCAMLHKEDEQRDNQEATEDEMTTEQTSNNQKNLKPSITLQKSHEEPNVRSQSENRRDGGTVEETVQTPGQCCGEIAEVNVEVRREESVQEPLMSDADVSIEQRCIKYWSKGVE